MSPAPDTAELVLLVHARRVHDTLGCRSFLVASLSDSWVAGPVIAALITGVGIGIGQRMVDVLLRRTRRR